MSVGKFALLLAALPLLAACSDKPQQGDANANAPATARPAAPASPASAHQAGTDQDGSRMDDHSQNAAAIAPPKPSQVLEAIYQKDSHGQDAMAIANGSEAKYWYGYAFELQGKHYYTGFAYDTPDKFGKQDEETTPAPNAKVTLTQATFELAKDAAAPGWSLLESERFIGEFGSFEKADAIDDQVKAQGAATADGRLLLAVPTWYLASGSRIKSFSLFVYRPTPSDDPDDTSWTYLGNIPRGEDNGAACDADGSGNHVPCVTGAGTLSFVPADKGLPELRVALAGTGIDDAGQKKTYGAADAATYRFNPQSKVYEAAK